MSHYYYVVFYDEETKQWIHDCDTEQIRLDGLTVWNTDTEEWESGYLGDGSYNGDIEKVDELFYEGLKVLNILSEKMELGKDKNE